MIAAILLREHAGYGVDINSVPSGSRVTERVAKQWAGEADGPIVTSLVQEGRRFGYANLEVWPEGQRDKYVELVSGEGSVVDLGFVGYTGRSGWFVADAFARDPTFPISPEFYRAYMSSPNSSNAVLSALRQRDSVDCGASGTCCCGSATRCAEGPPNRSEIRWCPSKADGVLPTVLAADPAMDQGFNEEIARSNGMRFAIRYLGIEAFALLAYAAVASGSPQLLHAWRPSMLLSRLHTRGVGMTRVMLPSDHCGDHHANATGSWSCDFPLQSLGKFVSADVTGDPVVKAFFQHFSIPEKKPATRDASSEDLNGGGIAEILAALSALAPEGATRRATAEEVFDTACAWVLANENSGLGWAAWIEPRRVPIFADTMHWSYPYPALGILLLVAAIYIIFLEYPWLRTTLTPSSMKRIMAKNSTGACRTSLELTLRDSCAPIVTRFGNGASTRSSVRSGAGNFVPSSLPEGFWKGLWERAYESESRRAFWARVEKWALAAQSWTEPPEAKAPPVKDYVYLAHHTLPCFQVAEQVAVPVCRSTAGAESGTELEVELVVEECGGGAKAGKDFEAKTHKVHFPAGKDAAVVYVRIMHHEDLWQNSYWFQVRLAGVVSGSGILASPEQATVLVLNDDRWPANIPESKRGGRGISLMMYFIRADRVRRGEKWKKTMIAMCWLPVHSVFVATLVQKILVDHVAASILNASRKEAVTWLYGEALILVLVQLLSLGLNRWADVVQTRNRGRTGGIRQVHRSDLLRKFMHLEHSEHWLASDASWLYSAIYDADVITGKAYFQVFVLAQSLTALLLSIILVIGLAFWGYMKQQSSTSPGNMQSIGYVLGVFVIIPFGTLGVWLRSKMTWIAVIARKDFECAWFKSCTWIISHWRHFFGLSGEERVALEKRVLKQNSEFVPAHWDARDTMNDTSWITIWIQGVSYCAMLVFGLFALCEYNRYGIGAMEVGTFYALCKIYLSVGKYVGRLSGVFVHMQQAIVSLREIAALLNQTDQKSQRRDARRWERVARLYGKVTMLRRESDIGRTSNKGISFEDGICFVRPPGNKIGSTFSELRLRSCNLPVGAVVHVTARNERVLRTFLGLASKVLHPTNEMGEELPDDALGVDVPTGLKVMMLPTGSIGMGTTAPSIIEQLEFTGAPRSLCIALAECVGLEPYRETASLGTGSSQVFSIIRSLLLDPDVLCAFRPLSVVPIDMRQQMSLLMRLWQGGGGLPRIAEFLGESCQEQEAEGQARQIPLVYRSSVRTLIVGNPEEDLWGGFPSDIHLDLEEFLWKDDFWPSVTPPHDKQGGLVGQTSPKLGQTSPKLRLGRGLQDRNVQDIYGGS